MPRLHTPRPTLPSVLLFLAFSSACLGPEEAPPMPRAEPVPSDGAVGPSNRPLSIRLEGEPAAAYRAEPAAGLKTPLARRIQSRFPQLRFDPCRQRAAEAYLQVDPY